MRPVYKGLSVHRAGLSGLEQYSTYYAPDRSFTSCRSSKVSGMTEKAQPAPGTTTGREARAEDIPAEHTFPRRISTGKERPSRVVRAKSAASGPTSQRPAAEQCGLRHSRPQTASGSTLEKNPV